MTAKIDIKMKAGKSLEKYPSEIKILDIYHADTIVSLAAEVIERKGLVKLHPGDTITIEIL